ncbi:metacaspase-like protein, putative [Plasmodium relictum]|uniref:Metacaspase-like protein, putative n=1 Tax=Plasmodium relictum TaxID=85471 RepID=A0A1J1HA89_PLARL|nr:metacaspase-like protein, putative [Plasmodium relictum]CRH01542.1 metacaspase-like protein, putative [Plasmodium relictum]
MNSSNKYSPLYSSNENINIYKKNKKIEENLDTSSVNISCDSKGRILIKESENERKSSEYKNNIFNPDTNRNLNKFENYNIPPNNEMKKDITILMNNCDKKKFFYDNLPSKNYLNSSNINIMDCSNYVTLNNSYYKGYEKNTLNNNGKGVNNLNNRIHINCTDILSKNNLYNNSINNFYEENTTKNITDQSRRDINLKKNRNFSYDNNRYIFSNNNNPTFLNTYPPLYFYSYNNEIKSNNYFSSLNAIQKKDIRNNGNLQNLKYGNKNDKYFIKTITNMFNRKKDTNKSRIYSLSSFEFLKEFEKLKKNSSVNKNSVSAILQKKKLNDNISNTKSENNNTFNKIYNFIFPSSIKKSQNQNDSDKHVGKKEFIKSPHKNNQNYLINKSKEKAKVSFDSNNNIPKVCNKNHISYINQEVATNDMRHFNEKEETNNLLFFNGNPFLRKSNEEIHVNSKNGFLNDKHKYHEKIFTNIYQFTSGCTQQDLKIKNRNNSKINNLKEEYNNVSNKNYSKRNPHIYNSHKNESSALSEKEKIRNIIIEKINNNINQKLKMNYAFVNENQNIKSSSNPQNIYKENNKNQLKRNENKNSYSLNNTLQKQNILDDVLNVHAKGVNKSIKTCNSTNNKQDICIHSTIKHDIFVKNSEKTSKNSLSIKNDDTIKNKNNSNLSFIHANKYINSIFKNNEADNRSVEDRRINSFSKEDNNKNLNVNKNINNSFSEKDNIISEGISSIFESEKKNSTIKSKNLQVNENTKMNVENKKKLISHCYLNKFLYEKQSELNKPHKKDAYTNESIKPENLNYVFLRDNKLKNSDINNYNNKNTVLKLDENNKMKENIEDINDIDILKNMLNTRKKEKIFCKNDINENNQKTTYLNLLNNDSKNTYDNNIDDNFYVHSIVSVTDRDDSLKEKSDSQKMAIKNNTEANFSKENIKNKIDLMNDTTNNKFFQKKNKNLCKDKRKLMKNETLINDISERIYEVENINNPKSVNRNIDEISLLKSKVHDELNACIMCINNLTKNKKLFEQLKSYKNKLEKKKKKLEKASSRYSHASDSYYTMKNSYISSLICNEGKNNNSSSIKNGFKLHDDNNIIMNNKKTDDNKNIIHNIDNHKEKWNKKCSCSKEVLDMHWGYETKTHSLSSCDDKTISYVKTKIENIQYQKSNYQINLSDKYFLSETEKPHIGKKKALLITLNYDGLLEGSINDTLHLCEHLLEKFNFNELILLNDCNISYKKFIAQNANKKNIINNLNNFIINSDDGDVLFFYFCGYSIKFVDIKFSENHNFALLPQDHTQSNYIYSNEIFNIIKKLQGGKQLCVIFDTTYTSYFVPISTSITYNKNISATEIYKNSYLESKKKYFNSFRTFGKIRDRNVDSVYVEDLKRPLDYEIHKDKNEKVRKPLRPSIFFFSPDIKDRNSYELLIKNEVRGLLTYCIGKAIEILKNVFSYHDLFVLASRLLIHIKNEYKLKYIKFKLSFLSEHSPDDIKFLSHESLFLNKKKLLEEPLWKESIRLYNLNNYIQDIYELKEKKIQKNYIKKCIIIFIKDIKLCTFKNMDKTVGYFVSSFLKNANVNILYVRRNNTKCQKIVQDKIFFLEYIKLNLLDLENARIYVELFKKKKKNYFIARSVFNIRNIDGKYSLTDEKKNIVGIIDLTIKCVS